ELRTPLNAILGFGQILEKQQVSPLAQESIGYILKGGRHLLDLINEVLDIARVESGHIELSLEPIALDDIVPEACALMKALAAERRIRLDVNLEELHHNYVLADRQRLKQVLINLLANAIKYNYEDGQVEVFCHQKPDGWISLTVRDSGPGISPADLLKLFTPFERLSASNTEVEGTGLGLVLSQRLVTAMGGTLNVESILGQGSTFTIDLPQIDPPKNQATSVPRSSLVMRAEQKAESSYSVLCIEDNPSNIRLMETIFEMRPEITLLIAIQGSTGLDLARQHEPNLILLDLNLPDIHGSEVLSRLQQSALTRDIPVVVVSADATPKQVERLLVAGARDYLTKPLDVNQLLHVVDKFLQAPAALATSI
ncbi:MAG TPA: ATP-binding protein, partial [Abditibacterium sp.]